MATSPWDQDSRVGLDYEVAGRLDERGGGDECLDLVGGVSEFFEDVVDATPSQPMLITGWIRAGRAASEKTRLAKDISASCSRVTRIPEARMLVIIQDSPARFAVEGGRVLPEPGAEDDWLDEAAAG
jgi:phenylpyruvate tautomerase PptA (4-oxalocrotonate tautomerase family)